MQLDLLSVCQRWAGRKSRLLPLSSPIDPNKYGVDFLSERQARDFVLAHHYSGSYPAAIAAFGLFEQVSAFQTRLAGVCVFSVPMQNRAADAYGADGLAFCDLGRFVLLDDVGGNGETFFLRRALAGLANTKRTDAGAPRYALVLAYSDPMPRPDQQNRLAFAGHYGGIYQAGSAIYLGRAQPRIHWLTPDGRYLSARGISKIRNDERGADSAYRQLVREGAPQIRPGETGSAYVARALAEGPFRRIKHHGNHVYAIPAGAPKDRSAVRLRMDRGYAYPKRTDQLVLVAGAPMHRCQ